MIVPTDPGQDLHEADRCAEETCQALRRLGGRCEQLLVALYTNQGGPGYEEVAAKLDMPQGSIGPERARCLHKLLEIMDSMDRER